MNQCITVHCFSHHLKLNCEIQVIRIVKKYKFKLSHYFSSLSHLSLHLIFLQTGAVLKFQRKKKVNKNLKKKISEKGFSGL